MPPACSRPFPAAAMSNNMAKIAEARKTVEQLKLEVNIDRMKVPGPGEGGSGGAAPGGRFGDPSGFEKSPGKRTGPSQGAEPKWAWSCWGGAYHIRAVMMRAVPVGVALYWAVLGRGLERGRGLGVGMYRDGTKNSISRGGTKNMGVV